MSKIKLTGESSGYVEISAGSNAGNNTLELPTSGTRLVASDNDGNVTIGGTLTYADVTNVDSIGIVTARSGIHVGTGTSITSPSDNVLTLGTNNTERLRIDSSGSLFAGGSPITESDMNWTHDQYQRPHIFTGQTGGNPSDGVVVLASPETEPSNTRIGALVYGCKTSSTTGVPNSGIKAAIECVTNTNVSDAWKTGGALVLKTRSDNGSPTERLRVFSDGTIGIGSITSTTPVTPATDVLDGTVPELSSVLKIHRNNEHVSAGASIGLLISDRVNRGTNGFSPLVLEYAHDDPSDYGGPAIKGRRYNHGGFDGSGFELNIGNGDGLFNIVAGAHYNPADQKYSFDGARGAAVIKFSDGSAQGVVKLFGSEGLGDPGIGVTMLQHYPPPTFYAHQTVSQTLGNGSDTKVTYTTEVFDTHSAYNASTSTFTAPMSGYYWMHATLRMQTAGGDMRYDMTFRINGNNSVYSGGLNQQTTNDASTMATVIMDLNKGDTVEVYADQNGGNNESTTNTSNAGGTGMSHFTGYLVYPKDS